VLHHEEADTQRDPGDSMRESDQRQPTFREEQDKKEDANQDQEASRQACGRHGLGELL
jgi:hypothetical protein